MDQLPRLGKRGLICLLLFTCNYVVSVWRGFLFHWVLGVDNVILFWHSLSLPYNYLWKIFKNLLRNHKGGKADNLHTCAIASINYINCVFVPFA